MSYWNGTKWVADTPLAPRPPSRVKRLAAATAEAALITALTFGLIAGSAFAAKGGGGKPGGGGHGGGGSGGSGTISSPVLLDTADTVVNYGDWIRFNISTSSTSEPWVRLSCSQGGIVVAQGSEGYFERSLDDGDFGLYSPSWTSGAADCTAKLTKPDGSVLATTSFHVNA
jgi:hypothetical protein